MKKLAMPVLGVCLLAIAFTMGRQESDGVGSISTRMADQLADHYGTSREEISSWVVKVRNIFNTLKAKDEEIAELKAEVQELRAAKPEPIIEPTPDPISTPVEAAEEPKPQSDYAFALGEAQRTGQPLIVFVTADWCGLCHRLSNESLEPLRASGELGGYYFVALDLDHDPEAKKIAKRPPVLMRYQFTNGKWQASKMAGYKPKDEVLSFLKGSK